MNESNIQLNVIKETGRNIFKAVRDENQKVMAQYKSANPNATLQQVAIENLLLLRAEKCALMEERIEVQMVAKGRKEPCWIDTFMNTIEDVQDNITSKKAVALKYKGK